MMTAELVKAWVENGQNRADKNKSEESDHVGNHKQNSDRPNSMRKIDIT